MELRLVVLALDELDVHEAGLRLRGALEDQLRLLLRLEPLARRLRAADILAPSFELRWPPVGGALTLGHVHSLWKGGSGY